jgi:hypothetical protein
MDNIGRVDFDWFEISKNANRTAAELLRRNPDKIHSINLSLNHSNEMLVPERPPRKNQLAPPLHKLRLRRGTGGTPRYDRLDKLSSNKNPRATYSCGSQNTWTTRSSSRTPLYSCWTTPLKRRIAHFKEELVAASHREDRADSGLGRGHRRHRRLL